MVRMLGSVAVSAGLLCGSTVLLAPAAAAAEVAPQVVCDGATCRNDNDEEYVVYGSAWCSTLTTSTDLNGNIVSTPTTGSDTFSGIVTPHATATLKPECFGAGIMLSWSIDRAVARSRLPSGSGGY